MLRFGSSLCLQRQQQEHNRNDSLKAVIVCVAFQSIFEVKVDKGNNIGIEEDSREKERYNVIDELQGSVSSEVRSEDTSSLQCMGGSYV